jgi:branched-chain amino acid transport system substrate-binding protein
MEEPMIGKHVGMALASLVGVAALAAPALAQNEQFIPQLVYRTGAYAPNGVPVANGVADYYKLVNERDGGINGVKTPLRNAIPAMPPTAAWSATSG